MMTINDDNDDDDDHDDDDDNDQFIIASAVIRQRRVGEGNATAVLWWRRRQWQCWPCAWLPLAAGACDFRPLDLEPAAPVAAPTATVDLRFFAITIMTTLDHDEVGKGMILVSEVVMGDVGIMMQFAEKGKS